MIEAEPGTLLDDARPIGKQVFATRVVDSCFLPPQDRGRSGGGILCPVCDTAVRTLYFSSGCHVHWWPSTHKPSKCHHFYCSECWLLFDIVLIGELDSDGEYWPLPEDNWKVYVRNDG